MEKITQKDLAELIQIFKKHTGWTYMKMSEATGIDKTQLHRYLNGHEFPRNPDEVVFRVKRALSDYTKKKMKKSPTI